MPSRELGVGRLLLPGVGIVLFGNGRSTGTGGTTLRNSDGKFPPLVLVSRLPPWAWRAWADLTLFRDLVHQDLVRYFSPLVGSYWVAPDSSAKDANESRNDHWFAVVEGSFRPDNRGTMIRIIGGACAECWRLTQAQAECQ